MNKEEKLNLERFKIIILIYYL